MTNTDSIIALQNPLQDNKRVNMETAAMQMKNNIPAIGAYMYEDIWERISVESFGLDWEELWFSGKTVPMQGARFTICFEGRRNGIELGGQLKGTAYLHVRQDRHCSIRNYASLVTPTGKRISWREEGNLLYPSGMKNIGKLRLHGYGFAIDPQYDWVNKVHFFNRGEWDFINHIVKTTGYMQ